ncbi:hypothetical protein VTN00DRAFT_3141 [Thermoascus crustaceus]|uniref:uncharacterized protein n=1 Tax=Thermoascus crustaceus TaxID=5088 RepID=UPI003743B3CC
MGPTKPTLHPLKTPKSATFPSELHTSRSDSIKREDGNSTPITPPLAYTEFLKALTPVFTSPVSAGVTFPKFPIEKPEDSSATQPSTATSGSFPSGDAIKSASAALPPPSPFAPPHSAKSPGALRRLRIPQSLAYSPVTESPKSATTIRSPFSPSDWKLRYFEAPRSACGKPVSVRQVVTRTVTYKRTPLDPPPKGKGKRRKTNES